MSEKSQAIVRFIANLLPLYTHAEFEGRTCALSSLYGTIVPLSLSRISILWTMTVGLPITGKVTLSGERSLRPAICQPGRAALHRAPKRGLAAGNYKYERERLAQHFEFKTGSVLHFSEGHFESETPLR